MTTKGLIIGFALTTLLAAASPAISQQFPRPPHKKNKPKH